MGENSKIEWTHHTFNPWIGCAKVSPGCAHCYAEEETFVRVSRAKGVELWGKDAQRHRTSESYWRQPLKWNQRAICQGCGYAEVLGSDECRICGLNCSEANRMRPRVFCASLADVFEGRRDLNHWRLQLFDLVRRTPNLDWLLLTKRPENVVPALIAAARMPRGDDDALDDTLIMLGDWAIGRPPANVWLGTTVEDQQRADERIPVLLTIPARVHFLSMEPLLGPVDLRPWLEWGKSGPPWLCRDNDTGDEAWVIVGGESGPNARPMHPDYARNLRDQCQTAGVPFLFKQWGNWLPYEPLYDHLWRDQTGQEHDGNGLRIIDPHTGDAAKGWDDGLWAISEKLSHCAFRNVGKQAAGRLLDGREWNEVPR